MAYPSQLSTIFGQYVGVGTTRAAIDEAMSRLCAISRAMACRPSGSGRAMDELREGRRTFILIGIAILIVWAILFPLVFF